MDKRCPDCQQVKPLYAFPKNRSSKGGFGNYCKPCHNARSRASLERNGGARRYHMRRRYGIEPWEFDEIVAQQGGLCAICRDREPTHLDHDHAGKSDKGAREDVRGALCVSCNNGIGLFKDNPTFLRWAADYLDSHAKKSEEPVGSSD